MKSERELMAEVEKILRDGKWKFTREPVVGNTRPDFLVTTDNGSRIVLEVKAWKNNPENTVRALHQAQRYKELSKAEAALIITPTGKNVPLSTGEALVPVAGLLATLMALQGQLATTKPASKKQSTTSPSVPPPPPSPKKVFASMPFAMQYDDTFLVAIQPAAINLGAIAERVDHNGQAGNVVTQIQTMIKAAEVVVADLSDSRPNVLHEVGYAEALGKPVVQICSTPSSQLPFNVRNNQTIQYSIGQTAKLQKKLETELQKVI